MGRRCLARVADTIGFTARVRERKTSRRLLLLTPQFAWSGGSVQVAAGNRFQSRAETGQAEQFLGRLKGSASMSDGDKNPASTPTPVIDVQGDGRWMSLHHRFIADSKDKEPEVVFIGDSLVQLLHQFEIWRELFSPLHALNFGIGGDATQHVLWRLQNGELQHIRPKIVVLWVGTNNHGHTAEQVAAGIEAIVRVINQQQPQARVVVLGLLPRGKTPNPLREKNRRVNELLEVKVPLLPNASFLNVDPGFVHSDGTISHHDMYDYLHLTRNGYARLCPGLHRLLLCLLGECHAQTP
ncbi:platelet-activating factor acetylhydrolase IB subunit alpha1 isoform X1 [Crotalus tigris]|uniref:platelet-activating factor acetylhydrolase IB subunit alpha1 isoform X1 n=1 Tax=Crotalus tigris TaxID=88082 RepID=UPI00192F9CA4|nr:platelet-activating factor acetylhydrolase IB subunit alpha1 isoform X1 [Crotalus tigris]